MAACEFVSFDAGRLWQQIAGGPHLHADFHALLFTRRTADGQRVLHVGSDGGLASINLDRYFRGLPDPFRSNYNRNLPTLQLYATLIRQFYGTLDGSPDHPGLVCVGTQDNGNLYCRVNEPYNPWIHLDGGDGGWNAFLSDGNLAHNVMGEAVRIASFDNPAPIDMDAPLTIPPDPKGLLAPPAAEAVVHPTYRNAARQLIAAVAARGNEVYGLYIDESNTPRYHWERIVVLPADLIVTAVASFHGGTVFAGTQSDGRILAIDTRQGTALELPVVLPKPTPSTQMKGGTFTRIVAFREADVFAVLNGASEQPRVPGGPTPAAPVSVNYVVRLEGLKFVPTPGFGLPNEYLYGCAAVTVPESHVPRAIVVCTDAAVYITRDDGATWQRASQGLPRRPHCGDLRFVSSPRVGANLYLGTFGRSLWVPRLATNG